ncbi:MAG: SRPBCC family protein [Pseudolysinimonas sp.]|uniref:SRPBCC family protein n=1 Tax=Pseudolysinimonas sp. TaxID=2680009 RepID=UPI0032635F86
MTNHVATAEGDVNATIDEVWAALTNTDTLGEIMFGSTVETDWTIGSPIIYRGEWEGKPFEDRGTVLELTAPTLIRVSHESPGSDETHEVRYELRALGSATHVTLTQDGNSSVEAAEHSSANWRATLDSLRRVVEHPA